ncbi:LysR family transcriptional regulator [Rahnella victoriana]|uniref:LysR family transcriptional regulator n=1 Tax=Rahnella victoriana TaxID=1510570 RepID=UPI001E4B8498|nr:LysR family transcriptional regulator [Rahnella victoriana]UHM93628.1 LysR family transcriptional regulator [Rahnella victoriana]
MAYKLDLNLLRILCMLVETQNVTETARRLKMGVSSVSYGLNKLRDHYSDPIMIRVKNGMQPTLLAVGLYKHFAPALDIIEPSTALSEVPGKPGQYIRVRTSSIFQGWLAWHLTQSGMDSSTGTVFEFNDFSHNADSRVENLRRRQVNVDIGSALPVDSAIAQYPFTLTGFNVVCRPEHPRLTAPVTLDDILQETLVVWVPGSDTLEADKYLLNFEGAHLLEKPLRLSSFETILALVARTDFVGMIPACLSGYFEKMYDVKVLKTEFAESIAFPMFAHTLYASRRDPVIQDVLALILSLGKP